MFEEIETDVLVLGAGGAGLRAAIEAHDRGAEVLTLGKSLTGKAHTAMAEGGIAAPLGNVDPEDSWEQHFADTMRDGVWINDYMLVEEVCRDAVDAVRELESFGTIFDRSKSGEIDQRAFGAHTYRRTCYIGDRTGLEIMNVLTEQVRRRGIRDLEEVYVCDLFADQGGVTGALALDFQRGRFSSIEARAVVVATGGHAGIYGRTTNPWETTGDGLAMALRAGADLVDMEMVQFHPTGLVRPPSAAGVLVTESVRGEGGRLYNAEGERFMERYSPDWMELAPRDVVASAIFQEVEEGRGLGDGGVHLDVSHRSDEYIEEKLPKTLADLKELVGVDIRREPVEVTPTTHYTMGGVRVDTSMETSVDGLFAAGEAIGGYTAPTA